MSHMIENLLDWQADKIHEQKLKLEAIEDLIELMIKEGLAPRYVVMLRDIMDGEQ